MIYLAAFLFLCYVGYKVLASIYRALNREAAIDAEVAVEVAQHVAWCRRNVWDDEQIQRFDKLTR